jgi:hypothetical protein
MYRAYPSNLVHGKFEHRITSRENRTSPLYHLVSPLYHLVGTKYPYACEQRKRVKHHIVTSYLHVHERNRRETARMLDPLAARPFSI